ncbi:MAG: MFS transporter [Chloroflexota bacterium]
MKQDRFFYGYRVVLAGFLANALSSGIGFYGFSVFNKPIGDEFHWSRSSVAAGFLIYSVGVAAFSPVAGRLTDRHGPRRILFLGTVILSASLILLSRVSAIWNFYLLHLLLGTAITLIGAIPVSVNISNWFHRMRGTMQGIALGGMGFGGLVLAPLLGNYLIPNLTWRGAYLALALLAPAVMLPLLFLVVRDHPHEKNLLAYGEEIAPKSGNQSHKAKQVTGLSLRETLRVPAFWIIVATAFVYGMSITGALQNQVSILSLKGFPAAEAVVAIGVIGLFSGAGKFLFGYLCDRIEPKYAAAISYALVGSALVALTQGTSTAYIWLYAMLMGLGQGGWAPNLAMLAANYFGLRNFGTVLGAMHLVFYVGEAIGPWLAGLVYDRTGGYLPVLMAFLILCFASVPVIALARRPSRHG